MEHCTDGLEETDVWLIANPNVIPQGLVSFQHKVTVFAYLTMETNLECSIESPRLVTRYEPALVPTVTANGDRESIQV